MTTRLRRGMPVKKATAPPKPVVRGAEIYAKELNLSMMEWFTMLEDAELRYAGGRGLSGAGGVAEVLEDQLAVACDQLRLGALERQET